MLTQRSVSDACENVSSVFREPNAISMWDCGTGSNPMPPDHSELVTVSPS